MLLPPAVQVGDHPSQVGELAGVGTDFVCLAGESPSSIPISRVPRHHAAQQRQLAHVLGPVGPHAFEDQLGSRDVAGGETSACLLRSQCGHALRRREFYRLGVGGGRVGLAGSVEQLRAQRKKGWALVLVGVLEHKLGRLGAVAVGTHTGGPFGGLGEERDRPPSAARADEMERNLFWRRTVADE